MSGMTTSNSGVFIRSNVWANDLKEVLQDQLQAVGYVDWLTDFNDGTTINIPSIGEATLRDYGENDAIVYDSFDTGNFTFTINEYLSSATYITRKNLMDSFYMSRVQSQFVPKQARAIMEHVETKVFGLQSSQTAGDLNAINGVGHRFVGSGASDSIALADCARAKYALHKAHVPLTNLVAIVDPSVEYTLNTITNLTALDNNPRWEGIIETGLLGTGMRFVKNVFGFDVYASNYLATGLAETVDSNAITNGAANLFFSAAPDVLPFIGKWRQMPEVDSEWNKDRQREEHVTTAYYDVAMYRPENFVVCLTDTTVVS